MQRNRLYILAAATLAVTTLGSCQFEDDDKFSESAAQRIDSYNIALKSVLTSADGGWCIQYFPNSTTRGYNIMASFSESGVCRTACIFGQNNVAPAASNASATVFTMSNDDPSLYREAESLYGLDGSNGSVLAMTSYNEILSAFSSPQLDGVGLAGDDRFVLLSSADEILTAGIVRMKGSRYGGMVRMVRSSGSWKDELTAIYDNGQRLFGGAIASFRLEAGDSTMFAVQGQAGILHIGSQLTADGTGIASADIDREPFIVTPDGIRFQTELDKNGVSAIELNIAADGSALVSTDGQMRLVPMLEDYVATHDEILTFDVESLTGDLLVAYNALTDAMTDNGFAGVKVGLGCSTGAATEGSPVWGLVASGTKRINRVTRTFSFAIGFDVDSSVTGENSLTLEAEQRDANYLEQVAAAYGTYNSLAAPLTSFASMLEGSYAISADDNFAPSVISYAAKQFGGHSFRIVK